MLEALLLRLVKLFADLAIGKDCIGSLFSIHVLPSFLSECNFVKVFPLIPWSYVLGGNCCLPSSNSGSGLWRVIPFLWPVVTQKWDIEAPGGASQTYFLTPKRDPQERKVCHLCFMSMQALKLPKSSCNQFENKVSNSGEMERTDNIISQWLNQSHNPPDFWAFEYVN